jgi:type I restriction enzyme M protein
MGQAYEYLVGKFADDAGNTAQEFYTNRTVVELMAEILQPQPDESIYDPTCGSGGMLIKSLDHLRNQGKEWKGVHVFGQEVNGLTSSIARMNLYLNGVEDFSIVCGDTLRNPAFLDGSHLRTFDIVLANPPYSIKEWDRAAFENDKWGRNFLGTPPQGRADYAFIQHILASMDEKNGRCAILLPHGVLFRKEEKEIREKLINMDILDTVIGIGKNLFFNSGMDACIMLFRKNKPAERKNKVLFIDAHQEVTRKNAESYMEPHHIAKIVEAYRKYENVDGFSKIEENRNIISNNKSKLSIKRYVRPEQSLNQASCTTHLTAWQENMMTLHTLLDDLNKNL